MSNEITAAPAQAVSHKLTAKEIKAQHDLIIEVQKAVMKEGVHFGKIPGCGDKYTLLKSGAETLKVLFRLADETVIEDLSTDDEAKYRVTVKATYIPTGEYYGSGIGIASSNEEKYMWREAICEQEFAATAEDRKRVKYKRGKGGSHYTVNQVRTSVADIQNTVLKMAKKRASVDMVLNVTAASDVFNQDLEDMPEEVRASIQASAEATDSAPPVKKEEPKAQEENAESKTVRVNVVETKRIEFEKKDGKKGVRFEIMAEGGEIFKTFSEAISKSAAECSADGCPAMVTYKNGKFGNDIIKLETVKL